MSRPAPGKHAGELAAWVIASPRGIRRGVFTDASALASLSLRRGRCPCLAQESPLYGEANRQEEEWKKVAESFKETLRQLAVRAVNRAARRAGGMLCVRLGWRARASVLSSAPGLSATGMGLFVLERQGRRDGGSCRRLSVSRASKTVGEVCACLVALTDTAGDVGSVSVVDGSPSSPPPLPKPLGQLASRDAKPPMRWCPQWPEPEKTWPSRRGYA